MAAKKRRRRKASLANRAINAGLMALAFLPVITNIGGTIANPERLLDLYTAGLWRGSFSKDLAARAYAPIAAAFILFEIKKMAMKKFRF